MSDRYSLNNPDKQRIETTNRSDMSLNSKGLFQAEQR
jgi:hypothetical protein